LAGDFIITNKMKIYKCPICAREREIDNEEARHLIMILCPSCQEEMREMKRKVLNNERR